MKLASCKFQNSLAYVFSPLVLEPRHAALNMMRTAKKANITHKRRSIRLMRKSAGWRDDVLIEILAQVF